MEDRFLGKVLKTNSCWIWNAYVRPDGYGYFSVKHKMYMAHRISYEIFKGKLKNGKVIDHKCHNKSVDCGGGKSCIHRRCVNPNHLEQVNFKDNILNGKGFAAQHSKKSTCKNGHRLSGDNLYKSAKQRVCRTCNRAAVAKYQKRIYK